MKRIFLLATGGTIATKPTAQGLVPQLSSRELLDCIPEIAGLCQVETLQLFNLDSTNLQHAHWIAIAQAIRNHYDQFDGFVISHDIDTMAYTAAALSYLIQGSPKPIVLTGAQKPIGFETTDSKQNLRDAFTVAASEMHGVVLVFNGKVILGTRARKTRSKSFEAFSSINYPFLALVRDGSLIRFIQPEAHEAPVFFDRLNRRVSLIKLIPGMDSTVVSYLLERTDSLIIESFGVGGLPIYQCGDFFEAVQQGLNAGKTVVMTTQVENEGSDLSVYRVGTTIKQNLPILEAYDMTTEAVVAKLMWILGQTTQHDKITELFYTPVACDILLGGKAT